MKIGDGCDERTPSRISVATSGSLESSSQYLGRSGIDPMDGLNRPKLLYVTARPPWPLDSGGKLRQYHVLRGLAQVADVSIVCLGRMHGPIPAQIRQLCRGAEWVKRPESIKRGPLAKLWGIVGELWGDPADLRHPCLEIDTVKLFGIPVLEFDIIWFGRIEIASLAGNLRGRRNVLDMDDIEHRKLGRDPSLKSGSWLNMVRRKIGVRAWRKAELTCLRHFDAVAVCSGNDRDYLGASNVVVIQNGATVPKNINPGREVDGRMLFVGLLSYRPNDDALCYFIEEILPLIRLKQPNAHLQVVGREPSPRLETLAADAGVDLLGYVEDLSEVLTSASISVAPIRIGGGTRLKILEALAWAKATVATTIGAEGLGLSDGVELLLADDAESFAMACCRLLGDAQFREDLADRGRKAVIERSSWEKVETDVQGVFAAVMGAIPIS